MFQGSRDAGRKEPEQREGEAGRGGERKKMKKTKGKGKTRAESGLTEPTAVASGSKVGSRTSSVASEKKKKKLAPEMEAALGAALAALFQYKQHRALQDWVGKMHWEFNTREAARKNAMELHQTLGKGDMGYSLSKQCAEEQRQLAFVPSGAQPFDQVLQAAEDAKVYDTNADDEAD